MICLWKIFRRIEIEDWRKMAKHQYWSNLSKNPSDANHKFPSLLKEIAWHLAIPLGLLVIVFLFFPSRERFEFSTDEGLELMKSFLVTKDYSLYDEIWSDQPPGLTYLLVASIKLFGVDVMMARYTVLIISCILMWTIVQLLRTIWGGAHAIAGAVLLLILPQYLVLSVSVMRGLPAIAFAMVSLFMLVKWHYTRKYPWLILSSIALGLSVLTKLFTGFLAPIFVVALLLFEYVGQKEKVKWYQYFLPALVWGVVLSVFILVMGLFIIGPQNAYQLLENHLIAADTDQNDKFIYLTINWHLRNLIPFFILAIVGTIAAFREKKWIILYPVAWSLTAYILLLFHYPVWDHHQHLITIPAVLPAANAVVLAARKVRQLIWYDLPLNFEKLLIYGTIVSLLVMFFRVPNSLDILEPKPSLSGSGLGLSMGEERFIYMMENRAHDNTWVVTDLPMYTYLVGLPVPPEIAVISAKRVNTGLITDTDMIEIVQEYQPEQVLLGRFEFPLLKSYLGEHYRIIHETEYITLYIRND
jgi:hypothetical protein